MRRLYRSALVVIFAACTVVAPLTAAAGSVAGQSTADITVASDGSGEYTSIQNAVDNATTGDRISVASGTYEQQVEIRKTVSIVATDGATITNTSAVGEAGAVSAPFYIFGQAEPTISGFTLNGWGYGIVAGGSEGSWTVQNVTINGGSCAVCASRTSGDWVIKNTEINDAEDAVRGYQSEGNWRIVNSDISGAVSNYDATGSMEIVDSTVVGDVSAGSSTSDMVIRGTTVNGTTNAVYFESTTGDLTIENTVIQNTSDSAVDADNSSGRIIVTGTMIRRANDGIGFEENSSAEVTVRSTQLQDLEGAAIDGDYSSNQVVIEDVSVEDIKNGIDGEHSSADWKVSNYTVQTAEGDGIDASDTTGKWVVASTSYANINKSSIEIADTDATWEVRESALTSGEKYALNAGGAGSTVNASYNYWGERNGPSGDFSGSGSPAIGNVVVTPYYVDAGLTTLSETKTSAGSVTINTTLPEFTEGESTTVPVSITPEQTASGDVEQVIVSLAVVSPTGETVYIESVDLGSVRQQTTVTFGESDGTSQVGPLQAGGGYTATVSVDAGDVGVAEANKSFTVRTDSSQDPTQRALQITGKDSPEQLSQDDVTAAITRFNRGESVNNVTIAQDDITNVITIFERN